MRWGAHLPLVDFGEGGARVGELRDYVRAARELGFDTVSANDHLLWRRPWLDGLTALSAVVEHAAGMTMATSVALPAVRHPVVLAKSLATLAVLHAGPFIAGIGPGSGRADYAAVGVPFPERWTRFDEAARILRAVLRGEDPLDVGPDAVFAPLPDPAPQVWMASWGSRLRLRGIAGTADGWFASGYNTDPARYAASRAQLDAELRRAGREERRGTGSIGRAGRGTGSETTDDPLHLMWGEEGWPKRGTRHPSARPRCTAGLSSARGCCPEGKKGCWPQLASPAGS